MAIHHFHPHTRDRLTFTASKYFKLVVFKVGTLTFALRIESVYKVVTHAHIIYGSDQSSIGIAHLDDLEITVVDIQDCIARSSVKGRSHRSSEDLQQHYLIVVNGSGDEFLGIPTANPPSLMEVPLEQVRVLPEIYRRADVLNIASHLALIPQEPEPLTMFVIDVDQLLPTLLR